MRTFRQVVVCAQVAFAAMAAGTAASGTAFPPPESSASPDDGLFTNEVVRHLRIEISESNLAVLASQRLSLNRRQDERPEVPADVWEGNRCYSNVAVHLKGGPGTFRPVESKPSLTLKFNEWVKDQRFHGLEKISLNNSLQDPTWLNEKLCRELYLQAGVPVPRADYATIELSRRQLGLYGLTEGWDKTFLKRHFINTKGNLYDPSQQDINQRLRVTSGKFPDDQSELETLTEACAEPDPARRLERIGRLVDLDRFVTFLALENLTWSWDNYSFNRNNYRLFFDVDTQRLVFMPHGLDQMFVNPEAPLIGGTGGLVSRAVVESPEGWRRVLERIKELRGTIFTAEALTNRAKALAARLRPSVAKGGRFAVFHFDLAVGGLIERIRRRVASVDEQLEGIKGLVVLKPGEWIMLTNWQPRAESDQAVLKRIGTPESLRIELPEPGTGMWVSKVWLERGRYVIEGLARTTGVRAKATNAYSGAGLRVWSPRKQNKGLQWSWFPGSESMDALRRGEISPTNRVPLRVDGDTDWTSVRYEIDLREPVADLEVWRELRGASGEAWFDVGSLRLRRE